MNKGLICSAHIKGTACRHCFVSLPHLWRPLINEATVTTFKLENAKHPPFFVSWVGHTHDTENEIFLNKKLLQINGFTDGEEVIIQQVPCPLPCTIVSMNVSCESDWEILLLNYENASENFLSQIRIVAEGQLLPLWLDGGVVVVLKVVKFPSSAKISLLQSNTEVHILPPSACDVQHSSLAIMPSSKECNLPSKIDVKSYFWNILYALLLLLKEKKKLTVTTKLEFFIGLRVISFPSTPDAEQSMFFKLLRNHPSLVVISKKHILVTKYKDEKYFHARILKVDTQKQSDSQTLNVIVVVWEHLKEIIETCLPYLEIEALLRHKTCILSQNLIERLSVQKKSLVILETLNYLERNDYYCIDVSVRNNFAPDVKLVQSTLMSQISRVCNICPIIFNDISKLTLNIDGKTVDIILKTMYKKSLLIHKDNFKMLTVRTGMKSKPFPDMPEWEMQHKESEDNETNPSILVHEDIFNQLLKIILNDLTLQAAPLPFISQFIMLQGSKGSGKTTLVENLIQKLSQAPHFINCSIIHLKLLKGKKVDSVYKIMKTTIKDAQEFQPSLIVLDDVDFLIPAHSPVQEEKGAVFEYMQTMAFMMKKVFMQLLESMKRAARGSSDTIDHICVLATCCSRNGVHSFLSLPKGNHIFAQSIHIPTLDGQTKFSLIYSLLKSLRKRFFKENFNLTFNEDIEEGSVDSYKSGVMIRLDGLILPDLIKLSHRIFLHAKRRWNHERGSSTNVLNDIARYSVFNLEDFNDAFSGFFSLSSRVLNPTSFKKEKKIGGLHNARRELEEMIVWPSEYSFLFDQAQLRLRSGVLLYGPPGCGKTLIAQSFENSRHLNFIMVKGPELLSKYIGQSEKRVRDAFERAESAKPCVLFFDEFEAIAPRRGHDNTGVTDRVVNQLLTQMDGVEGLLGVYVIAATSRPDLIDPALLRPGRLDKGICCPLPDERDREEILSLLCEEINVGETINVKAVAQRTDGFTGADLQSILSTAQLKAAQESVGRKLYEAATFDSLVDDNDLKCESLTKEFVSVSMGKEKGVKTSPNPEENKTPFNCKPCAINASEETLPIHNHHIEKALCEGRPSVNQEERLKYETLHRMFSKKGESKVFSVIKPGKRETLA